MPRRRRLPGVTMPPTETPPPQYVRCGPQFSRLEVWTEAEWATLPAARRPRHAVHAEGLGWVVAVPLDVLN